MATPKHPKANPIPTPRVEEPKPAPPPPAVEDAGARALTLNGKPISPEEALQVFYRYTDQGIAEENARKAAEGRLSAHRVEVRSDPFHNALDRMEDLEAPEANPFLEKVQELRAADPQRFAGMEFRGLSDRVVKRRGMRGWKAIVDERGSPVKVADMTMAVKPAAEVARARRRNAALANEALQTAEEQYVEQTAKIIRDGRGQGMAPLRPGEILEDARHPGRAAQTGFHMTRGDEGHAEA
jgi:hypothetical protein